METCDVLVLGGGPAGSSVAWGLRRAGLDVVVMDRAVFPRDKTCAGWITPQVLELLAVDPAVYAKAGRVLQPIHGFGVRRIGDAEARTHSDSPVSYGIRRCELDHYLLARSEARLRLGEPLARLERHGDRWRANGALETPVVVAAGGHFCPVVRSLVPRGGERERVIAAKEVEFELRPEDRDDCPVRAETPEIFFSEDLQGYGWVFRKGDHLNVGLGRRDRTGLTAHLEDFLAFLRAEGRLPRHLEDGFHGHAYLLQEDTARPRVADGALVVGDAAGLAYPRSGEGIRPAVESGLLAARELEAAQGFDAEALAGYAEALAERFGPAGGGGGPGLTDWLPAAWSQRLAGWLFARPWFASRVVVDRWFVHAHEPARL